MVDERIALVHRGFQIGVELGEPLVYDRRWRTATIALMMAARTPPAKPIQAAAMTHPLAVAGSADDV